jgi:ABC-type transport system substrate-binding protein
MKTTRREFLQSLGAGAAALTVQTVIWTPAIAQDRKFTLYLTVFNNNQARMIWSDLIGKNIAQLGVEVVTSFVPLNELLSRRTSGATYLDGGFDMYTERMYYPTLTPQPNTIYSKAAFPPAGSNFYRIEDDVLDKAMVEYSGASDPAIRAAAIKQFQERWYDIEPLQIIYYPEDVIATNPKLKGLAETTYTPVFFPRAENWTIEGATGDEVTAVFASWPAPSSLVPMFVASYSESNVFGPVHNSLMEYDNWQNKKLVPALAESITSSEDGRVWKIKLREGVLWHSGEPFTAEDVKFTWDTILNPDVGSVQASTLKQAFGDASAYKIVSPSEIEVTLPSYNMIFEAVLGVISIMPKHAYESIKPDEWRNHTISNWSGSFTVTTSSGKTYEAKGGIGTGPWIADGFDAGRSAYRMRKNQNYWKSTTGNVNDFYVVNIQGADAVLAALRSGEIDAHDPMYEVGTLANTIDPSWATLNRFDSNKWQQTCLNLSHPVFGTGVDTPLGKSDPARAAEAATYVRKAFSHVIPREEIIRNLVGGFGAPGTVPIAFTAPEYDKNLKPIAFDMDVAREYMNKAGYTY